MTKYLPHWFFGFICGTFCEGYYPNYEGKIIILFFITYIASAIIEIYFIYKNNKNVKTKVTIDGETKIFDRQYEAINYLVSAKCKSEEWSIEKVEDGE